MATDPPRYGQSQPATFAKTDVPTIADDEVVENVNADQFAGVDQSSRKRHVVRARCWGARAVLEVELRAQLDKAPQLQEPRLLPVRPVRRIPAVDPGARVEQIEDIDVAHNAGAPESEALRHA